MKPRDPHQQPATKRVLLLGANGQLAADLRRTLGHYELVTMAREDLDLTDLAAIGPAIERQSPDVVVNTAAYNLVDKAEEDPLAAFAVNTHAAGAIARASTAAGALLVHFSTDYVFDGQGAAVDAAFSEEDLPSPQSQYGISKLAGEYQVRAYAAECLVIRTCGLYGVKGSRGKGGNFVETMLRLAAKGGPVRVVADQRCTPTFTADLAEATARLLATRPDVHWKDILHVTNAGRTTWHDFAKEIFEASGLEVPLEPISTEEFGAPARRPVHSVLSNEKLARLAGIAPPRDWRDALRDYLSQRPNR
ncbi:dTDP-4-dehydrorhamnose reductase [Planctomycetes bacterium Pan216]|uniref:dTDP-4-dehydrorhamnose reductase n=1 Tax=Kolteria novifilia TaxID=2527975 RepID=A0A518BB39_9BACT|nr:dTDP-4-dehydrorhamnose reductase [Planctomycetes bacterium Pan216]